MTWKQDFERREQELLSERSTRLTEIGADLRRGLEELRVRGSRLVALRDDLHRVTERKLGLRRELEQVAAASQIHRFARLLSGAESAADVSREDVRTVSVIWFGSLAAIVAWTGTLLALAANVVANGGTTPDSGQSTGTRNSRGRTLRSLRRFFVAERRRRGRVLVKTETKEIVKEVPVERVIVKEVEVQKVVKQEVPIEKLVPIETRVRDIKYVPVPVNDPEGLQRGLDTTNARLEDHTESNVTRLSSQAGGATHS